MAKIMDFKGKSMRKGWSLILIVTLGFTGLHADVRSGKMFYMKHMKTTCGGDEPETVPAVLNPAGQSTASPF